MTIESEDDALAEAIAAFEREVGVTGIPYVRVPAGNREFLKFVVGREAPVYTHALRNGQKSLGDDNPFRGAMGLAPAKPSSFPASIEANALLTLLTRSTREVSQDRSSSKGLRSYVRAFSEARRPSACTARISYRPRTTRGGEVHIDSASYRFARRRCRSRRCARHAAVLDAARRRSPQGGSERCCIALSGSGAALASRLSIEYVDNSLSVAAEEIMSGALTAARAPIVINRALKKLTSTTNSNAFVFLDDFHLINLEAQPALLHTLHAALKGANGWIKVAGLSSLLNVDHPRLGKAYKFLGMLSISPLT